MFQASRLGGGGRFAFGSWNVHLFYRSGIDGLGWFNRFFAECERSKMIQELESSVFFPQILAIYCGRETKHQEAYTLLKEVYHRLSLRIDRFINVLIIDFSLQPVMDFSHLGHFQSPTSLDPHRTNRICRKSPDIL